MFYASNKNVNLAHAERQSFFFWVAVLSLSWFQVGQENVIFYKRHLLRGYVASEHCSENPAPCSSYPANGALLSELQRRVLLQRVERGKERCKTKRTSVTHESNSRQDLPTRSPASLGFSQQCLCVMQRAGACTTPQRHAFLNCKHMCAPSLTSFPHPQRSGGNSCRMLPVIHLILSHL